MGFTQSFSHYNYMKRAVCTCAGLAIALSCLAPLDNADAVTAAEKRAEADEVYAQIDSLQTNLNEAMAEYERAQAAHDDAIAKRDEASQKIEEESQRIEQLMADLGKYARETYKQGGSSAYVDVLMGCATFDQFVSAWDACNAVSRQGQVKIEEAKATQERLEAAKADYEAQGQRAEEEMGVAEEKQAEIEATQDALRSEAEKLSAEADELQMQEELAAEAARQAEEARKRQEEALAAARKAEEEQIAQAAQAAQSEGGEAAAEAAAAEPVTMGTGYFTNPCPTATSSSGFGYRTFDNSFHKGLDMAAPEGTPYYAADSGTVMYATNGGGYNGGAGNWVVIAHGNGIVTKYMHSSVTYVNPGDHVERGQNIGAVGNTGNSFGAHLHFQVEVNGVAVNPLNYI